MRVHHMSYLYNTHTSCTNHFDLVVNEFNFRLHWKKNELVVGKAPPLLSPPPHYHAVTVFIQKKMLHRLYTGSHLDNDNPKIMILTNC